MDLPDRLAHVRWIGGGTAAGKTTVAQELATGYGAAIYDGDLGERGYVSRCSPERQPHMTAWIATPIEERWSQPPEEIFLSMASLHGETFGFVIEDLFAMPDDRPIIVDDFRTLPSEVVSILTRPEDAVFLMPTPEFRRSALERRYADPARARSSFGPYAQVGLGNRLSRDALWDAEIRRQADLADLAIMTIDGTRSAAAVAEELAIRFRLGSQRTRRISSSVTERS
jgi:hypothetical protein